MSDSENQKSEKYTASNWDKLRASFQSSMLVDTRLSSLAESLDTESWPLKGKEETPAKYIDYSFDELQETPEMQDHPDRVKLLIDILDGTLAFDDPFGDMVQTEEANASEENEVLKNLRRLEIPPEFPISLTNLSPESRQLCQNQNLTTLQEFAEFSQNMAQHIVLAGDFRKLLNSLVHIDEKTLAGYLPYRPGTKGLHLPEAIAFAIGSLETEESLALYRKCGGRLEDEEKALAARLSPPEVNQAEKKLKTKIEELFTWFDREKEDLDSMVHYGQSLDRFFVPINDPAKELIATRIVGSMIKRPPPPAQPAPAAAEQPDEPEPTAPGKGILRSVSEIFRKIRRK